MKVLNWNVAWCGVRSARAPEILKRIKAHKPDAVSLTEVVGNLLPGGATIASDPDYGYGDKGARRKNQLWSRRDWTQVDWTGSHELPSGRFVFGQTTDNDGQPWRMIGLCFPWRGAQVSTGRKNRKSWQEHEATLHHMKAVFDKFQPHVITGDFNQRLPFDPKYQVPRRLYEKLETVFHGYRVVTRGLHSKLIDHTAVAPGVKVQDIRLISNERRGAKDLTDHLGTAVVLSRDRAT